MDQNELPRYNTAGSNKNKLNFDIEIEEELMLQAPLEDQVKALVSLDESEADDGNQFEIDLIVEKVITGDLNNKSMP